MDKFEVTLLQNGLSVVSEHMPSARSVAIGLFVGVGGRYEKASEAGTTHFIEHMLFKGTKRRTARDIVAEVESRGGTLNAYTEKEYTCYYARALAEDAGTLMDVLADMIRNPLLAEEDIEREKNVVAEEIRRAHDDPEDLVQDLFDRAMWKNHALGRPILGSFATLRRLNREFLLDFIQRTYVPPRMVLAAAGRVSHRRLVRLAERYFGDMHGNGRSRLQQPPHPSASVVFKRRRSEQVQFCLGVPAFGYGDPRKYSASILDQVLGGSMSSRLFQEVREKRGLAYDIGSHFVPYRDCGMFAISGGTSAETFETVLDVVHAEMMKVCDEGLTSEELGNAKKRVRGAMALALESSTSRMLSLGRSMLLLGRVVPLQEVMDSLEAVGHDDVIAVARDLFSPDREVIAALGPLGNNSGGKA